MKMIGPTLIYNMQLNQFDIVKVPFPFTELPIVKRRPALVISKADKFHFKGITCKYIMTMITSSAHKSWPSDVTITDLNSTGLSHSSIVRMKIFTLDETLILDKLGSLGATDSKAVHKNLASLLGFEN